MTDAAAPHQPGPYEYLAQKYSIEAQPPITDCLNARAVEGWELFQVVPVWFPNRPEQTLGREVENLYIFRRPRR